LGHLDDEKLAGPANSAIPVNIEFKLIHLNNPTTVSLFLTNNFHGIG